MPKRDVKVISHSVLTNHRIVAQAEEPFPDIAFHLTTPQLPDLVNLSADPARHEALSPLTLLEGYSQIVLTHPEYRLRYWLLAAQLKLSHPQDIYVLEALADQAVQKHDTQSSAQAIEYLQGAVRSGTTNPVTFEELAKLLADAKRESVALDVLRQGIQVAPYDVALYKLNLKILFSGDQTDGACAALATARQQFPQDDVLRGLADRCDRAIAPSQPNH